MMPSRDWLRLMRMACCALALWAGDAMSALRPGGWEPAVRERLDALIERNRGNPDAYAVFDFDYTTAIGDLSYVCMWQALETFDFKFDDFRSLMAKDIGPRHAEEVDALAALAGRVKPFAGAKLAARPDWREFVRRYWALYRGILDDVGDYRAYLWRSRLFTGYTADELRNLAKAAVPGALARGGLVRDANAPTERRGLVITPEMKDLFRELRRAGIAVYLVSGSYRDTLLVAAGPDFGLDVPPENIFGAELKKDAQGRFVAEMTDDCVKSGHKLEFIRARIAPRHHGTDPVLAAGDSMGDYTMLTGFRDLQVALLFRRQWREKEMSDLCASGGRVAVQGRDEARGCFMALGSLSDVDPFFGSGGSTAAPSEGMARGWNWEKAQTGNTHPGAVLPFGWVSACGYSGGYSSGYGRFGCSSDGPPPERLKELKLFGFTHFHHNGTGWIGAFLNYCRFTPYAAGVKTDRASSVRNEAAAPGYYAAELVDYGSAFELTTDRFVACHRYRFPKGDGRVRVDLTAAGYLREIFGGRPDYRESVADLVVTQSVDGVWSGYVVACGRPRFFALAATDAASANVVTNGVLELAFCGTSASTALGFSDESVEEAVVRAQAAADKGFDAMRAAAVRAWAEAFGGIRAEFAEAADRKRFYSALYHSFQKPVEYRPGRFAEFTTTWDTYRAQLPLAFSFAAPTARALALSLLATSEELGYFPNTYLLCKHPSHNDNQATALGAYVLADACFRGLLQKDEYPRVKAFLSREFADADISRRSVTHVLDVAGAYCAAAFVAEQFGDADAAKGWRKKADMWRRAYDPRTGLLPKSANFYEGDERNYSFRPHVGMNGRVTLAGGTAHFEAMLDDFFAVDGDFSKWTPQSDRRRRPGHFEGLNNECDMNTPLAWFWAGRAERVCEIHDLIRRCRFSDGPGALPGNNDSGGTSAWYVWSCLGLYPLSGAPYVFLVSPTVDRAQLAFACGGNLTVEVERNGPKAIYPSEIIFNGQRLKAPWLTVSKLQEGGRLVFRMSEKPTGRSPVPTWL